MEGEHGLVTSENIAMVLDIAKYGIEERQVKFNLISPPVHGTLTQDLIALKKEHSFNLANVNQDKVYLINDNPPSLNDYLY